MDLKPTKVPFDQNGNLLLRQDIPSSLVCRETGRMFHRGEDYDVLMPDGRIESFKDHETRLAMHSVMEVKTDPQWRKCYEFEATMTHIGKGRLAGVHYLIDQRGCRYPILREHWLALPYDERNSPVKGRWTFVVRDDKYFSVRLVSGHVANHS